MILNGQKEQNETNNKIFELMKTLVNEIREMKNSLKENLKNSSEKKNN